MRLHRLEITAFGPFAEPAVVDFDELSSAGLFLLCGPTGAGKTSVLDAVCFAVYGDVPGDRSTARRLRCDTAPEGRAPRVVLELTISGRRFRITRSPQWTRPKKRGSGETAEQARVLLEERQSGAWVALSSRIDEANHLLNGLVGMTLTQFCQVAMLPQGRFQAFLRARSEERHTLLQQLFGTRRFEDIEKWLRERSRTLHRDSRALLAEVSRLASRVLEVAATPAPQWLELDDPGEAAGSGALATWTDDLRREAEATRAAAEVELAATEAARQAASAQLEDATRIAALQRRHSEGSAQLARLQAEGEAVDALRARAGAARQVAPLVPLHKHALTTAQQRDRLGERALTAEVAAAAPLGLDEATSAGLRSSLRGSRELLSRAEALLPQEAECQELARASEQIGTRLVAVEDERGQVGARLQELPGILDAARAQEAGARVAAAGLATARAEEEAIRARLVACTRVGTLEGQLADARAALSEAVVTCQAHKEAWLDLREARLAGMAAEIAADLAVGACCPVCGSADHPAKASRAPGSPDAAAEKGARVLVDDAELAVTALEAKVRDLTATLAVTLDQAGDSPLDQLESAVADASARSEALAESANALPGLGSRVHQLEEEASALATTLTDLAAESADLCARQQAAADRIAAITTEVERLLDGTGLDRLDALVAQTTAAVSLAEAALAARADHDAAAAEAARAAEALAAARNDLSLAADDDILGRALGTEELAALEERVARHEQALAAVRAVIAEPEVVAAAELPSPDLAALRAATEDARDAHTSAAARLSAASLRAERLQALADQLGQAIDRWRPVRDAHAVASELASFVEGKSPDNQLRMRLSAYVLAWRLSQVVAAANDRLLRMSGQRYTLEHSEHRGAGETRGGLSMLVRDAWSGEARDPATLSGGETFVVSLALALGLADVVTGEAGGADLDTLFVDEGFGALDADTLDDVMDTLDTLRDGGRVVGVVSHVGELRTRIPTRLQVGKSRRGSTLTLVHAPE